MQAGFDCAFRTIDNLGNFGDRQVLKKVQHQDFPMAEADFSQCLMNCGGIFGGEGRLVGFLKVFELDLLGAFSGCVSANAVNRDAMRDGVEPRAERTGVFELSDAAEGFDPDFLKDVEAAVWIAGQAGGVVEQRALHGGDQVFKGGCVAGLAAQGDPFIECSIVGLCLHSYIGRKLEAQGSKGGEKY